MRPTRILFVCTGNLCRSPTAEGVLRTLAEEAGLAGRLEIDSAGTEGWHAGKAPDPRAVRAAGLRGYELVELRGRKLTRGDFQDFDLIVAMGRGHRRDLEALRPPDARARVHLLLDFAPEAARRHGPDVPDPYSGEAEDFEHALDLIEAGARGLLQTLRREFA